MTARNRADAFSHTTRDPASDPTLGGRFNLELVECSPYGAELARWRLLAEEEILAGGNGGDEREAQQTIS